MATELWKKAFEKLKFPDKELSPDIFENNNETNSSEGELAYERSDEITDIEKFQIEEEKACVTGVKSGYFYENTPITDEFYCREPQRDKLSKEKTTTLIIPVAETKETEVSDKNCKGTIPEQKKKE